MVNAPEYLSTLFAQGVAVLREGDAERAASLFAQVVAADPAQASAQYNLGLAFYQLARWDEAAGAFDLYVKLEPGDSAGHLLLGLAWREAGKLEHSLAALREALRCDRNQARIWRELGKTCLLLDRLDAAKDHFKWAVRLKPQDVESLSGLAEVYRRKGLPGPAVALYQLAIERSRPAPPGDLYLSLARLYRDCGHWENARVAYEGALKHGCGQHEDVVYELGLAFFNCGDRELALRQAEILSWMNSPLGRRLHQIISL